LSMATPHVTFLSGTKMDAGRRPQGEMQGCISSK